jgi:threonine dehydrogenase-like Zn-dependent dehydrogenase
MKAIMYNLKISTAIRKKMKLAGKYSMIKYRSDWPKPSIEFPRQVLVRPIIAGICASDIHQIDVDMSYSASILARKDNPFPLGHETVGVVEEVGSGVRGLKIGDRVTHSPVASCKAYGFEFCESCREARPETCRAIAGIGDGSNLEEEYGGRFKFGGFGSGGFSEHFITFEDQLRKVPDELSNDIALLAEPLAVAIHAVKRREPTDNDTVLVIGAGIIGLMIIKAIRGLGSKCRLIALVRYPFQGEVAKRFGADDIISESDKEMLYQKVADLTRGQLVKPALGKKILYGRGPDIIFDSVGTDSTLDDAIHLVKNNGGVVIVGMGFGVTKKTDWALGMYKEVDILCSMMHGIEDDNGRSIDTFDLAFELMKNDPSSFTGLITHRFDIDQYKTAFSVASSKEKNRAIKVAFRFE